MREVGVAVTWLISVWWLEKGADRPLEKVVSGKHRTCGKQTSRIFRGM